MSEETILEVTAPVRIDYAGGWTDSGCHVHEHGGAVLNAAIDIRVKATFHRNLTIDPCEVPPHSGLGTSGAMRAAEVHACNPGLSKKQIVESVYTLENKVLRHSAGYQDQAAAVHGGVGLYLFSTDGSYKRLDGSVHAEWLEQHTILVSTGESHRSGNIHDRVFWPVNYSNIKHRLLEMSQLAENAFEALGDYEAFLSALKSNWAHQKELHESIMSSSLRQLSIKCFERFDKCGFKALGAGGGGVCMVFTDKKEEVMGELRDDGEVILPFNIDLEGLRSVRKPVISSYP
jgi:D-glycero-alpha-D-manno-heptose-7-phosphate kinase